MECDLHHARVCVYVCVYFTVGMNLVIPHGIRSVCVSARMHMSPGLLNECTRKAGVIFVSDRMMLGEAVHINPIHIREAKLASSGL